MSNDTFPENVLAIQVAYLLAPQTNWLLDVPAYNAVIHDCIRKYVDSFLRWTLIEVGSLHYMAPAIPKTIVEELEKVIENIAR